jgi:hypothetical protein
VKIIPFADDTFDDAPLQNLRKMPCFLPKNQTVGNVGTYALFFRALRTATFPFGAKAF